MFRQLLSASVLTLIALGGAAPASAQLATGGPVVYGHHHFYVSSIDVQKKFWVDALGGTDAGNLGPAPVAVVRFPGVHVLLNEQVPTGGTRHTSVNHVGFKVPDLRAMVAKVREAGYPIVSREDLPPAISVDTFPTRTRTSRS